MSHQSLGWVLAGLLLITACLQSNESLAQATETEQETDAEIRRVGEVESRKQTQRVGEVESGRVGKSLHPVPASPCPRVPVSPCPCVTVSPRLSRGDCFLLSSTENSDSVSSEPQPELTETPAITDEPFLRRVPRGSDQEWRPNRQFLESASEPYKVSPGVSIMNPSAYGASWGKIGIGVGYQDRTRFTDNNDAVVGLAFGLGDAQKYVGLEVGIGITDVDNPFSDGKVSLKLHRQLPEDFNIALGVQGIGDWGETDGGSSVYGVVSKRIVIQEITSQPFSEIYLSLGVGGGQFRSESDIDNGVNSVGVFGSVAVRVIEPISFITEWTGQDLTLGLSIVPFRNLPFVIVPAITDVTNTAGDGTRFILGASYRFSF